MALAKGLKTTLLRQLGYVEIYYILMCTLICKQATHSVLDNYKDVFFFCLAAG